MANSKITVESLNLHYGENHALKNVNMEIADHAITAFIGPSGCGKSTFLRCLNRMNDLVDGLPMVQDCMASRIKKNWMRSWSVPCWVPPSSKK